MSHWDRWLKSFVKKKCKGLLTISLVLGIIPNTKFVYSLKWHTEENLYAIIMPFCDENCNSAVISYRVLCCV